MNIPYKGVTCRGSIILGTGCRTCDKCLNAIAKQKTDIYSSSNIMSISNHVCEVWPTLGGFTPDLNPIEQVSDNQFLKYIKLGYYIVINQKAINDYCILNPQIDILNGEITSIGGFSKSDILGYKYSIDSKLIKVSFNKPPMYKHGS